MHGTNHRPLLPLLLSPSPALSSRSASSLMAFWTPSVGASTASSVLQVYQSYMQPPTFAPGQFGKFDTYTTPATFPFTYGATWRVNSVRRTPLGQDLLQTKTFRPCLAVKCSIIGMTHRPHLIVDCLPHHQSYCACYRTAVPCLIPVLFARCTCATDQPRTDGLHQCRHLHRPQHHDHQRRLLGCPHDCQQLLLRRRPSHELSRYKQTHSQVFVCRLLDMCFVAKKPPIDCKRALLKPTFDRWRMKQDTYCPCALLGIS